MRSARAGLVALAISVGGGITAMRAMRPPDIDPLPVDRILRSARLGDAEMRLVDDGCLYRVNGANGKWSLVERIFDPDEIRESYARDRTAIYRVDRESGRRYRVLGRFEEGFEGVPTGEAGLRALIGEARKWTEVTLQSPQTPTVRDYVALRSRILKGAGNFLDARVEPSRERAHGGVQSLKCTCPARSAAMVCSKASLRTGLSHFVEGQDVWYRAWYLVAGPVRPFTLVDVESSFVKESPGIRLMLFGGDQLGAELKALDKPTFRQGPARRLPFPVDRWVQVVWHTHLDAGPSGRVRIWQDGRLVVDASGPTLPYRTAILDGVEVGISAHSSGEQPSVLFVDDITIDTRPIRTEPPR